MTRINSGNSIIISVRNLITTTNTLDDSWKLSGSNLSKIQKVHRLSGIKVIPAEAVDSGQGPFSAIRSSSRHYFNNYLFMCFVLQ